MSSSTSLYLIFHLIFIIIIVHVGCFLCVIGRCLGVGPLLPCWAVRFVWQLLLPAEPSPRPLVFETWLLIEPGAH